MGRTLDEHYGYLSDPVKVERYGEAIRSVVRAGHVVLDLGCGAGLPGRVDSCRGTRSFAHPETARSMAWQVVSRADCATMCA